MAEYCRYKTEKQNGEVKVIIGNHPPIEEQGGKICQILTEKEGSDSDCINLEMGEQTCPISPLCNKKN